MDMEKPSLPTETYSTTEENSKPGYCPPDQAYGSSNTEEEGSRSSAPSGQMTSFYGRKAVTAFRSDHPEDGLMWLTAFCERYTDTRTALIITCVKEEAYVKAAEILEQVVTTAF